MKASFFEFNVATTGLTVAKNALNVAGHNIANAETPGYSRQVALMKTNTPLTFYDGRGMIGTGAQVYGIGQIRSAYMDQKYQKENSVLGEYSVKNEQLTLTESIFNSLSTSSTTTYFDNFFSAVSDLSTTANEETYRTAVLQSAESLAKQVNSIYSSLEKQQEDLNEELSSTVTIVNSIGIQIKNLNEQITKYEMDGSNANDLRDQRALLVDELSTYVNVSVKEYEVNPEKKPPENDQRFKVQINGNDFVNHFNVNTLDVRKREAADPKPNPEDVGGLYDIVWSGSNEKFDMYHSGLTGQLKALIDMRDGNGDLNGDTTEYKGIPYYMARLNGMVQTFARAVNEGKDKSGADINGLTAYKDGYDKDGNPAEFPLFTYKDDVGNEDDDITDGVDYTKMTAKNFMVSSDLQDNPQKLAASSSGTAVTPGTAGESNNEVLLGFSKIKSCETLFDEGSLNDYVTAVATELGVDLNQAEKFEENYTEVLTSIEFQRLSVMGVDIDEESANIVRFNQLYQASAKLINVINEIYDTLINGLGV